jgi:hypothetical protein
LDSHQHDQRARWPILAYRSVDWQPNDRLGRVRRQLFEHRREVLRRHTKPNTHTNADAYPNVHANSDTNSKPYPYSHTNADGYPNVNANFDTETFTDAESCANA